MTRFVEISKQMRRVLFLKKLWCCVKVAKYEIQKASTLFRCKFLLMFLVFTLCDQKLLVLRNKNICCRLMKGVAKSRAVVNFEQQILASLLVFYQAHNLSHNKN